MWQILPLLDRLGIRVLASITGDARFHEIACAHRARVNMVVCSQAMVSFARAMEERYGIPYFEGSFYGISDISTALREIARLLVDRGAPADLLDPHRSPDRGGRERGLAADRGLPQASAGQACPALHRRRQVMVRGLRIAGDRT